MGEGIQKRVQPDLVREIEGYSGGSFSEKMVKWKNDVDTPSHNDFDNLIRSALEDLQIDKNTGEVKLQ